MAAVKSSGTSIELVLRKELWKRRLRYRINTRMIFGKPDIAFLSLKIAVFCDGEFWHGFGWDEKNSCVKTNSDFWEKKIRGNIERDKLVNDTLRKQGWIVLRFWETEILKNTEKCADMIEAAVISRKNQNESPGFRLATGTIDG